MNCGGKLFTEHPALCVVHQPVFLGQFVSCVPVDPVSAGRGEVGDGQEEN